jgi:hypothetical protein
MSALPIQYVFDALHDAGLIVSLASGGGLAVSPGSRLTPDLRELVKANKSLMVDWLQAANDPAPEVPADPNAWRELAAAYNAHHFKCSSCIAAGRGAQYSLRCGVGAALWASYQDPEGTT